MLQEDLKPSFSLPTQELLNCYRMPSEYVSKKATATNPWNARTFDEREWITFVNVALQTRGAPAQFNNTEQEAKKYFCGIMKHVPEDQILPYAFHNRVELHTISSWNYGRGTNILNPTPDTFKTKVTTHTLGGMSLPVATANVLAHLCYTYLKGAGLTLRPTEDFFQFLHLGAGTGTLTTALSRLMSDRMHHIVSATEETSQISDELAANLSLTRALYRVAVHSPENIAQARC